MLILFSGDKSAHCKNSSIDSHKTWKIFLMTSWKYFLTALTVFEQTHSAIKAMTLMTKEIKHAKNPT